MKSATFIKLALVAGIVFAINRPPSLLMAGASLSNPDTELLAPTSRECMIGEITLFAGNFTPRAWASCEGQLLAVAQNQALFSILGTTYGGDGRTTFGLPDLRGRVPVGIGQGPGLSNVRLGVRIGQETATLTERNLPPHSHGASVTLNAATPRKSAEADADGKVLATGSAATPGTPMYTDQKVTEKLRRDAASVSVDKTGAGESFSVRDPGLGVRYIICINGIYPSRS